ncbi:hypothetical protein GCM10022267_35570 [Lentzea roselyniae]|uniref:Uncharacterized protein n=1 Tax=Lentzea roselyniae TaxID=531940 RepID=A0ABP7B0Z2_9PSEU
MNVDQNDSAGLLSQQIPVAPIAIGDAAPRQQADHESGQACQPHDRTQLTPSRSTRQRSNCESSPLPWVNAPVLSRNRLADGSELSSSCPATAAAAAAARA